MSDDPSPDPAEPVALPIEDTLDLHSFPPREVADLVREWLAEAHARGHRELRIIHGRGIGVQREIVRNLLAEHPLVADFRDAGPGAGGWGATWVCLRSEQLQ